MYDQTRALASQRRDFATLFSVSLSRPRNLRRKITNEKAQMWRVATLEIVRSCSVFSVQEVSTYRQELNGAADAKPTFPCEKLTTRRQCKRDACKTALRMVALPRDELKLLYVLCALRRESKPLYKQGMMQLLSAIQIVGGRPMRKQKSKRSQEKNLPHSDFLY
jgi:hypothetical protein